MWIPVHIDENRPEPLYRQVEEQLRGLILGGQLAEGTLLPSIREFAADLRCSAITVRRVYQDLESEGLLRTRQGTGTFVAGIDQSARDVYRLSRVVEAFERAVETGLQLRCTREEMERIWQEAYRRKAAESGAEKGEGQ